MLCKEHLTKKTVRPLFRLIVPHILLLLLLAGSFTACADGDRAGWIDRPPQEWPQITMINHIQYGDTLYPVAGCSFLLDVGEDTISVTAKHVLTYFKSKSMKSVSFNGMLEAWMMFPKNNSKDVVIVDGIINEDARESIDDIPSQDDWLLLSLKKKSSSIQPLAFREAPLVPNERVFIIG
ncbi:MAG: hypothetical protein ABIA59_04570, partial [Candidatus Latescibacterota bacterium]